MTPRKRIFSIVWIFIKIGMDFRKENRLIQKHGYTKAKKLMSETHRKRAGELHQTAISLGGVMIKLCQFLSARRDAMPEEYIEELSSLQDDVPPVPFNEILSVIQKELGRMEDTFLSIEEVPLASASLGQVHRGILHTGEEVAIKVLKPGVEDIIDYDFAIVKELFTIFSSLPFIEKRIDIKQLIDEFIIITGNELNFKREADFAKVFSTTLAKLDYMKIPMVYDEFSTDRVIVMEYCSGNKITDVDAWKGYGLGEEEVSRRIVELYAEQILSTGIIHFDPHPGNILINNKKQIVLLDFGMTGEISSDVITGFQTMMKAVVAQNPDDIIDGLIALKFLKPDANRVVLKKVITYAMGLITADMQFTRETYLKPMDMSPLINEVESLIYEQPFTIPSHWAYMAKTLGTVLGILTLLDPNFNLTEALKPYYDRFMRGNITSVMKEGGKSILDTARHAASLPKNANNFFENIELGRIAIKTETSHIENSIASLKDLLIRLTIVTAGIILAIAGAIFYSLSLTSHWYIYIAAGALFITTGYFMRRKTVREKMVEHLKEGH